MLTTCALAGLALGAWWLVTWPDRTVSDYMELVDLDVKYRSTVAMAFREQMLPVANVKRTDLICWPRRLTDVLRGRRMYLLPACVAFDDNGEMTKSISYVYIAERGKVERTFTRFLLRGFPLPDGASFESASAAARAELD
jgi:hypothetical protein